MGLLTPSDPEDQPGAFLWLIGGAGLIVAAVQQSGAEFDALDWALLVIGAALVFIFGTRLGFALGYVAGKGRGRTKPRDEDE